MTYTQPTFRGLIIPSADVTPAAIDAVASSFSQASPAVGVPTPQADTDLNLQATGTQSAGGALRVATVQGGFGGEGRASFRWQEAAATDWQGWNSPTTIDSWRALVWTDGTPVAPSNITATASPHSITTTDGTVVIACHTTTPIGAGILVTKIGTDGSVTKFTAYSYTGAVTMGLHPCLLQLPSGRVLLFHYIEDSNTSTLQVGIRFSDDLSSWSTLTTAALDAAINIGAASSAFDLNQWPARGLRVAYSNGQYLMLIGVRSNDLGGDWRDYLLQYASSDGGYFEQVDNWGDIPDTKGCRPAIIARDQGFTVFYVSGILTIEQADIGSAYSKVTSATTVTMTAALMYVAQEVGDTFSDADFDVALLDSGEGYLTMRIINGVGNFEQWAAYYSRQGFTTDDAVLVGQGAVALNRGLIFESEGGGDYPRDITLAGQAGRLLLCHNWAASTGNEDASLGCMFLGGYSNRTLPSYQADAAITSRLMYETTWLPIELTSDVPNWAHNTAGAFTQTLQDGAMRVTTTAGKNLFERVPAGTPAEGITLTFGCAYVSAAALSSKIRTTVQLRDGASTHTVFIAVKSSAIEVYDTIAAATVGILSITTTGNGVEVLMHMNDGKVTVFARQRNFAVANDWQIVSNGVALAAGAGGIAGSLVQFGHLAGSTAESDWHNFAFVSDQWACNTPFAAGFTNPADLKGRAYGSGPTLLTDGVSVAAISGPTVDGDTWHIDARYRYPVDNMHPLTAPSPLKQWRSTDESLQSIVWDFGSVIPSPSIGLHLEGVNFKTGTLYGWNASTAAWDTLIAVDTSTGQTGVQVRLIGDSYLLIVGSPAQRFVEASELIGGTIEVTNIGTDYRRINANTQGVLTAPANGQTPIMKIDLIGGENATGTAKIWSPRLTCLKLGLDTLYTQLKFEIDANQNTVEGYYQIGQMVVGPLAVFTHDYSWGRIQDSTANTDVTTYRDGSRSSVNWGKSRRSVQFGWAEGVDTTTLNGPNPTPDKVAVTSTASAPVGFRGDLPTMLTTLSERINGAHTPLVYVPTFDYDIDAQTIQGRAPLYGRMISPVSVDTLVGEEGSADSGELIKVSNITIEGEL